MLDLEQDCDCKIFNDERHQRKKFINVDPEQDVEMRINKQIEKSIADILSEIIQNALHQSMEEVITFSWAWQPWRVPHSLVFVYIAPFYPEYFFILKINEYNLSFTFSL